MSNGKGIGVIEVEANIAKGAGSNVYERWWDKIKAARDEIEAAIKALVVLFLTIFGILTFKHAFPGLCDKILFNIWMVFLLICILSLGIILYAINTISPRSQETKREKNLASDLRETFTHVIALIITVPLITATVFILLVGGNHSEELAFISGLLGVIVGFYFGHRGIESAESQRDKAMKEKEVTYKESIKSEQARIMVGTKTYATLEEQMSEFAEELDLYKKEEAWNRFKEQIRNIDEYKDFKGIKNIGEYIPWEEPEVTWNDEEEKLITKFNEEWEDMGGGI